MSISSDPDLSPIFRLYEPTHITDTFKSSIHFIQQQRLKGWEKSDTALQCSYQLEMGTRLCLIEHLINENQLFNRKQIKYATDHIFAVQNLAKKATNSNESLLKCESLLQKINQLKQTRLAR